MTGQGGRSVRSMAVSWVVGCSSVRGSRRAAGESYIGHLGGNGVEFVGAGDHVVGEGAERLPGFA